MYTTLTEIYAARPAFEASNEGTPGTETVSAPWGAGEEMWTVGEGEAATPWYQTLPDEAARAHVEAKGYKTPAELALANYSLTKLQRGDPTVIGLPAEDATPEQMSEFYGKLGRPDAPDGYEFKFEDGVKVDPAMQTFAQQAFHEAGLTPAQAQIVADKWNAFANETNASALDTNAEQNDAALAALQETYGADLDKNKKAGRDAMAALGMDADHVSRIEAQIGSATIVDLLVRIGSKMGEAGFVGDNTSNNDPNNIDTMSSAQAQARITELRSDPAFEAKYTDAKHPGHSDAVQMIQRLYARV